MKEVFIDVKVEIIRFDAKDLIATSLIEGEEEEEE